jgi:hypothetical protein
MRAPRPTPHPPIPPLRTCDPRRNGAANPPYPTSPPSGANANTRDAHGDTAGQPDVAANPQRRPRGLRDVDGGCSRCSGTCVRRGCKYGIVGRRMRGLRGLRTRGLGLVARRIAEGHSCARGGLRGSSNRRKSVRKEREKKKEKLILMP